MDQYTKIEADAFARAVDHAVNGLAGFPYMLDDESIAWAECNWHKFLTADERKIMEMDDAA